MPVNKNTILLSSQCNVKGHNILFKKCIIKCLSAAHNDHIYSPVIKYP